MKRKLCFKQNIKKLGYFWLAHFQKITFIIPNFSLVVQEQILPYQFYNPYLTNLDFFKLLHVRLEWLFSFILDLYSFSKNTSASLNQIHRK